MATTSSMAMSTPSSTMSDMTVSSTESAAIASTSSGMDMGMGGGDTCKISVRALLLLNHDNCSC